MRQSVYTWSKILFATFKMQVIKPLYYWESRHVVMDDPGRFLRPNGQLIGHAFILHPYKLSIGNASQVFQEVSRNLVSDCDCNGGIAFNIAPLYGTQASATKISVYLLHRCAFCRRRIAITLYMQKRKLLMYVLCDTVVGGVLLLGKA